jgi:hypothetical protein
MTPEGNPSFKNFFETGPIKELLEHPGELRYAGWDLNTRAQARIVRGEFLEVKSGGRKLIRLYEDGTLIAKVVADHTFLGWAHGEGEFEDHPRLNPVALLEFTFNFLNLAQQFFRLLDNPPRSVGLRVEIRNAFLRSSELYVIPYGTGTYEWLFDDDRYKAPENSMVREITVSAEELTSRPEFAAYTLAERIYTWFGVPSEKIPYASIEDGRKFIDVVKIKNVKS